MTIEEKKRRIQEYIIKMSKVKKKDINDINLFSERILDSINIVMLVVYLLDELNIKIPNDEMISQNFESLSKIYSLVDKYNL